MILTATAERTWRFRDTSGSSNIIYTASFDGTSSTATNFGLAGDIFTPGDYDGDGRTDYAVLRAGTNYTWYIFRSSDSTIQITQLGTKPHLAVQNGDFPIANYNTL